MKLSPAQIDVLKRVRDGRPLSSGRSQAGGRGATVQSLLRHRLITVENPGYLCITVAGQNALATAK